MAPKKAVIKKVQEEDKTSAPKKVQARKGATKKGKEPAEKKEVQKKPAKKPQPKKQAKLPVMKGARAMKSVADVEMTIATEAPGHSFLVEDSKNAKIPAHNKIDKRAETNSSILTASTAASSHGESKVDRAQEIRAIIREELSDFREEMFAQMRDMFTPIQEQITHMHKCIEETRAELRENVDRIEAHVMDVKNIALSRRQETQAAKRREDARKKDEDKSTGPPNQPQPNQSAFHMTPENKNTKNSTVPKLFVTPPPSHSPTPAAINDLYGLHNPPAAQGQTSLKATPVRSSTRKHLETPGTCNSAISTFTPTIRHAGGNPAASPSSQANTPVTVQDLKQWAKKTRIRRSPVAQMARSGTMFDTTKEFATKEFAMKAMGKDTPVGATD